MIEKRQPAVHHLCYPAKDSLQWYTGNGAQFEYTHHIGVGVGVRVCVLYRFEVAIVALVTDGKYSNQTVVTVPRDYRCWVDADYAKIDEAVRNIVVGVAPPKTDDKLATPQVVAPCVVQVAQKD
jgi:hypothetical protein